MEGEILVLKYYKVLLNKASKKLNCTGKQHGIETSWCLVEDPTFKPWRRSDYIQNR